MQLLKNYTSNGVYIISSTAVHVYQDVIFKTSLSVSMEYESRLNRSLAYCLYTDNDFYCATYCNTDTTYKQY